MPGLRARVQRDEHSGAWRPDSIGKEGKSPAVKERSLQTPQGGWTPHNSLSYPKVRSRGRAGLGSPGLLSSEPQVPCPPGPNSLLSEMLLPPSSLVEQRT